MDMFYRWVWQHEERYVGDVTHEHADAYMKYLAYRDTSNVDKANYQKAVKMLFKWREHEHGLDPWHPSITFSMNNSASQPRDFFTISERRQLREAALEYGSIPAYNDLTPTERDHWRAHLAQRFEKPKEESSKNRENWVVSIQSRTTHMLTRWLAERHAYKDYEESDGLWLTREGESVWVPLVELSARSPLRHRGYQYLKQEA